MVLRSLVVESLLQIQEERGSNPFLVINQFLKKACISREIWTLNLLHIKQELYHYTTDSLLPIAVKHHGIVQKCFGIYKMLRNPAWMVIEPDGMLHNPAEYFKISRISAQKNYRSLRNAAESYKNWSKKS